MLGMRQSIKQRWRQKWRSVWEGWLNRRLPATRALNLSHRSIFIVPTKAGFLFIALLVVMLLTGINYQNSLIYALVFWLFSLSLVAMLLTFRNLANLRIRAGNAPHCFAGDNVALPIFLSANKRVHESLYLAFANTEGVLVRVSAKEELEVRLHYHAQQRGRLNVERIAIESRFPLGLFRAWSWVKLDFHGLVYPKPEPSAMLFAEGSGLEQKDGEQALNARGEQDFYGLRNYQPGDSLKRIAWKQVAQGKGMISKEFAQPSHAQCVFSYQSLAQYPVETRLSRLCAWLLDAEAQGWQYGLEMPQQNFALNSGAEHLQQCLTALAIFGIEEEHA